MTLEKAQAIMDKMHLVISGKDNEIKVLDSKTGYTYKLVKE